MANIHVYPIYTAIGFLAAVLIVRGVCPSTD